MAERLRRWSVPAAMLVLMAVITIGIMTAPPSDDDRAGALSEQLRCPVCQGESVADSPSDTAIAIRAQIEEMVAAGRSDAQIFDHYVQRYGRWVLLDPPAGGDTLMLWLLPIVALLAGIAVVATRRRRDGPPRPLSDHERVALRRHVSGLRRREVEP